MITLSQTDVCHLCSNAATALTFSRCLERVIPTCDNHTKIVLMEDGPEYITQCKNCKCFLPVG